MVVVGRGRKFRELALAWRMLSPRQAAAVGVELPALGGAIEVWELAATLSGAGSKIR